MDRFDNAFTALAQRINGLSMPERTASTPVPLASLIDKVNAAKRFYQPKPVWSATPPPSL